MATVATNSARYERLRRAATIRNALEHLIILTSPDGLEKARERDRQLIWRRAAARAIAELMRDLEDSVPITTLFREARSAYDRKGLTEKRDAPFPVRDPLDEGVEEEIEAEIAERLADIGDDVVMTSLALVARSALRSMALRLGLSRSLPGGWDDSPEAARRALENTFPEQADTLRRMLRDAREQYVRRAAVTITNAAHPSVQTPVDDARQFALDRVRRLTEQQARQMTETLSSEAANGTQRKVMVDAGVEMRRLNTMEDNRVCPVCLDNAAEGFIPLSRPYPSGHMAPPIHPNCRCTETGNSRGTMTPPYLQRAEAQGG